MITIEEAGKLAIDFLMEEWNLPQEQREWFVIKDSRTIPDSWWYIVEIGLKNLPDKWVLQVYEEGECDPCYTFVSPYSKQAVETDLAKVPVLLAEALKRERCGHI